MMSRDAIRQTVIELLESDLGQTFDKLDDSNTLRAELGLDSVDVVSVISQIERRFRIRLSTEELQTLVTVGDVLDLLQSKINAVVPPTAVAA